MFEIISSLLTSVPYGINVHTSGLLCQRDYPTEIVCVNTANLREQVHLFSEIEDEVRVVVRGDRYYNVYRCDYYNGNVLPGTCVEWNGSE